MEIGFGLITCQRYPGDSRTDAQIYAEALSLAEQAELHGFDSVWVSEHHFVDDAYLPSALPLCAAIVARTHRIRIGTGLLLAPLHEPLRVAEDTAVVDLLSQGRLILGLGLGWRNEEFAGFGIPLRDRVSRLEDTVTVLRQAWSGGLVTGGRKLRYPNVPVTPQPSERGGPPIWIGAMAPPAVRRAGRIADGFMATEVSPAAFADQSAMALEERATRGNPDDFTLSMHMPVFAWEDSDPWDLVKDYHHYVTWKYEDMENAWGRTGAPVSKPHLTPATELGLRSSILVGSPNDVAEQIDAYRRAVDTPNFHFIARLYWPGMDFALQQEALAIFAERVIPQLR